MYLHDVLYSGEKFKRAGWETWWDRETCGDTLLFNVEDILATDWENLVEEKMISWKQVQCLLDEYLEDYLKGFDPGVDYYKNKLGFKND